jgi:hypothetical protein
VAGSGGSVAGSGGSVAGSGGSASGSGGGTSMGADGCAGAALNLSISEVAVYQSVKIPIANNQRAIEPGTRAADVIQGRQALFRVFVQLSGGWTPRTLSARLTLTSGSGQTQLFERKPIAASSSDADLATSFQIAVPADRIQTDTRYSVEVVECGAASGSPVAPRFPAAGDAALGARYTGPLKVRVVPVSFGGRVPDTSEPALTVYRDVLQAMYPVNSVELTVTAPLAAGATLNWASVLDQVRARRQSDAAPADVYYYGLLKPADTLSQYCRAGCTAGVGYVSPASAFAPRAAIGLGFADASSAMTMAHELGHSHGRGHAPCAPGSISGVDPGYPHAGARLGTWGYDSRTRVLHDPNRSTDIMGYCNSKWVSDYTYRALTDRVASLNAAFEELVPPELIARWRVVLVEPAGARWGVPFARPAPPFGEPETAEVLDAKGARVDTVTVYRTAAADLNASTVLVPEPEPSWSSVRLAGLAPLSFTAPVSVPLP